MQDNNKRIAKNTLALYIRQIVVMLVTLYTSRVVLNILGVEDYGIYSVVGGVVIILAFINNGMTGATQRFINVELGCGNTESVKKVFDSAQVIHILLSVVVLFLAETLGLWFLNKCMNIPEERMWAANWVYQFSVMTFIVNVISVPYNAAIIAHEKMSAFAYISIYEGLARLTVAIMLSFVPFDKLIDYGAMFMTVQITVRLIYGIYCGWHFDECKHFSLKYDKPLLRRMLSFSIWTIIGNLCLITHTQGIAIIINIFFGAAVNAAQGIANQVNTAVGQFVSNFLIAMNPQVVKNYATGDLLQMHKLIFRGCRLAFYLVSFFVIPLALEAPTILKIWLKIVPEYTVAFVRLVLIITLVNSCSYLLFTSQGATGNIKTYQILLTTIGLFHLPITAILYWMGFAPYYAMYVYLLIVIAQQATRVVLVSHSTGFIQSTFYKNVVFRCAIVFIIASAIPAVLHIILHPCFFSSVIVCGTCIVTVGSSTLFVGMTHNERLKIISFTLDKMHLK